MSHDVIGTMLCFSSVSAHGLSFYPRGFLNFAKKFCFDFSHLLIFFYKKTCFDGFLRTKFNVLLILLKFQCQFRGAALEN